MKLTTTRKDLLEGVQTVAHAVSGRSSLPILQHIHLNAEGEGVKLTATDLEIGIECFVPAVVEMPGEATLPARLTQEVLSSLPDADVKMSDDATHSVQIVCERSEYKLLGLSPTDYPSLPEVSDATTFTVPADTLKEMIKQTIFAVSTEETRAILTGVLVECDGVTLRMVATDTHRLTVRSHPVGVNALESPIAAVVPARSMNELARIVGDYEGDVEVQIGRNQASFRPIDDTRRTFLITRLIDGQFPAYQRVIPTTYTKRLTLATEEFLQAVRRASLVARDVSNRLIFSTNGEYLIIEAESGQSGKAHEEVEVVREGDDITVAFNARYLIDVLSVIESEGVHLEMTEPLRPAVVRPVEQDNYLCVLMPMALT
ncbi:MAG: DNA polymerase III subunit beta [Armatimonadota bacterium]